MKHMKKTRLAFFMSFMFFMVNALTGAPSGLVPAPAAAAAAFLVRVLVEVRHAVGHPLRRRRVLQVVIEELEVADRQVLAVRQSAQAVALARVREQDRVLAVVAERVVEREAVR